MCTVDPTILQSQPKMIKAEGLTRLYERIGMIGRSGLRNLAIYRGIRGVVSCATSASSVQNLKARTFYLETYGCQVCVSV